MYLCNCNGIREHEVEAAIADGAGHPAEIFHRHGCRAQCGRCVCEMQDKISSSRNAFAIAAE